MQVNKDPRALQVLRQVFAEVGLLTPPSDGEQKNAAENAKNLSLMRSAAPPREPNGNDRGLQLETSLKQLLGGSQKELARLMRALGHKRVL